MRKGGWFLVSLGSPRGAQAGPDGSTSPIISTLNRVSASAERAHGVFGALDALVLKTRPEASVGVVLLTRWARASVRIKPSLSLGVHPLATARHLPRGLTFPSSSPLGITAPGLPQRLLLCGRRRLESFLPSWRLFFFPYLQGL